MVSLDDAVLARLEKGGNRYEILVDPELVDNWKDDPDSVSLDELLAIDEAWSDAKGGDRPTGESLERVFGTTDLATCVARILSEGSIQLTTMQRRRMVVEKKRQIVNQIASTATDPKTRLPHPHTRIENALDEVRFPIDPFKSTESQVEDAVAALEAPDAADACGHVLRATGWGWRGEGGHGRSVCHRDFDRTTRR